MYYTFDVVLVVVVFVVGLYLLDEQLEAATVAFEQHTCRAHWSSRLRRRLPRAKQ